MSHGRPPIPTPPPPRPLGAEKRQVVVLLRWVLIIAVSYLVVFSAPRGLDQVSGLCVALFLTSNLVLMRLPDAAFHHRAFDPLLVAIDVALITLALWVCGNAGGEFFFVFFFVLFLAALGERPELTALGAALAAIGYILVVRHGAVLESAILLRVPFLFVTALTYGYLATMARDAQARAQAAEDVLALKRTFLATMSHEMRTPLNVIIGYGEVLREEVHGPLTAGQREDVAKINAHAFELLELIDRTLKASRLEAGRLPMHVERFTVEQLLQEVAVAVSCYEKQGVQLTLRAEPSIPPLVTDRLKLKEVVTNLVTNALKYTAAGSVGVHVRWPERDGVVEVVVRDTGSGIPAESRAQIFELFTRAPDAEASSAPGVGLGLYIVRRLLDILRGDIRVESTLGAGTTFTVRIPREFKEHDHAA